MRGNRGVTIVEFIAATLIFGISLASILGIYMQSAKLGKKSEAAYHAYNIAKNRIERLRNIAFTVLPDSEETETMVNENGTPDSDGRFSRTTDITTSFGGNAKLTQVTVQVYFYIQGVKSNQPLEMSTLIFQLS